MFIIKRPLTKIEKKSETFEEIIIPKKGIRPRRSLKGSKSLRPIFMRPKALPKKD